MRLNEFVTPEEWAHLEQLIFDGAWKALATYQQQRATQRQQQMKPVTQLKPKATARKGQLARKAKRAPHAAPPKPLPKPAPARKPVPPTAPPSTSYNPIKTTKPLPASTSQKMTQQQPTKEAPMHSLDMDQRALSILPKSKRGIPIWDLVDM